MLLRLAVTIALAAAIGWERERLRRAAGLRTHLLVAVSSATLMLVSTQLRYHQGFDDDPFFRLDPSRIAASVVVGIGFLGSGAILRHGVRIEGLTTGSSLLLVASLGLACGAGMYFVAGAATVGALFFLLVLRRIERHFDRGAAHRVTFELDRSDADAREIVARVREIATRVAILQLERDVVRDATTIVVRLQTPADVPTDELVSRLERIGGLRRLEVENVSA